MAASSKSNQNNNDNSSPKAISSEELAAAIAAVRVYLSSEEEEENTVGPDKPRQGQAWIEANLLEGASRPKQKLVQPRQASLKQSLWQISAAPALSVLVTLGSCLTIAQAAHCQNTSPARSWSDYAYSAAQASSAPSQYAGRQLGSEDIPATVPEIPLAPPIKSRRLAAAKATSANPAWTNSTTPSPAAANSIPQEMDSANSDPTVTPRQLIRVALTISQNRLNIGCLDGAQVVDLNLGTIIATLPESSLWQLNVRRNDIAFVSRKDLTNTQDFVTQAPARQASMTQSNMTKPAAPRYAMPSSSMSRSSMQSRDSQLDLEPASFSPAPMMTAGPLSYSFSLPIRWNQAGGALSQATQFTQRDQPFPVRAADRSDTPAGETSSTRDRTFNNNDGSLSRRTSHNQDDTSQEIDPDGPGAALQTPASSLPTSGYLLIPNRDDGLLALDKKVYRGALWLKPNSKVQGKVDVINIVDIEDYLLSVVPSEMPSKWPAEALKAQAIAARSFALANLNKHAKDGFDVEANTNDQVYAGVAAEAEMSNSSVAQTAGIILKYVDKLTYGDKPVCAYFHSGSGGWTEPSETVWGMPTPYLKSVPDFDDASPLFNWTRSFTAKQMEQALWQAGHNVGFVLNMRTVMQTASGHPQFILATGDQAAQFVSSEELRRILKLPSTNFNVGTSQGNYVFAGRGFGHGLGLSQWGSKALAEHGFNAAQILNYYYKDVTLEYM